MMQPAAMPLRVLLISTALAAASGERGAVRSVFATDSSIALSQSTATPSPVATATATAVPTHDGPTFRIGGCVEHFSGCGGSREFGVVLLTPGGRRASVNYGTFSFEEVPPGDYTLRYQPACNPAGCTGPVYVRIVDGDGRAAFYRSSCAADCSADHTVTVDELLVCVNAALGRSVECPHCDVRPDGRVTIEDLIVAVGKSLHGCY